MADWLWWTLFGCNLGGAAAWVYTLVWYVRRYRHEERRQMQAWADREREQDARWQEARQRLQVEREAVRMLLSQRQAWDNDDC